MVGEWVNQVKMNAHSDILLCLLGNKNDLEKERVVSIFESKKKKDEYQFFLGEEVSAKTGDKIKETFNSIAKALYQKSTEIQAVNKEVDFSMSHKPKDKRNITLTSDKARSHKEKGNCCN